jgi:hypothetical protein
VSAPDGTEAAWWRHVLYGLAGQTFEAQDALDKFETALEGRALREAAAKQRALPLSGSEAGVRDALVNLIDPDKEA